MARYTGSVCRLCRRQGDKLYLKGERCYTSKCSFERKPYAPGMHGKRRAKLSDYALQLREKQKVRRIYGMLEKAFVTLFHQASKERGVTADAFFRRLELRFDNVAFRMGFACNRNEARQLISHGHFLLNGKRCNIPSLRVKVGDK
ncbi:MAG: 30S ribosomal protein S4, partial [Proteobacteria bacterium]|nr:30S ribosomal protein S4 [Pseudomonadota bacterium]